ncbi:MAG: NAD-dependent epimerase/dehydratase family protein [Myxococcota bacterium]
MHVLVTGGAGYIGSTLVPLLLDQGHEVTVLDRFYFGQESLSEPLRTHEGKLRLVRGDVRSVSQDVFEGVDAIVDLAGISNDPACELDEAVTLAINLEAAERLSGLAHQAGVERIVFASSCSVYGHGHSTELVETSPLHPVSLYAKCKADAEKRLWSLADRSSMTITALRLATVFGVSPRMRFDLAINVMSKNAYVDRRITVEGGGRQWRPFVHVKDVAKAMLTALEAPHEKVHKEVFNVGHNDNNLQIMTLAYRIRDLVPNTEIILAPTDPDRRDYNVRFDKIERVLGYRATHTIDDGIREVVEILRSGKIDAMDRRWYTLKQYIFLADVERTYRSVALDGQVLL